MKRLILLRGVPGAGKTEFAKFLIASIGSNLSTTAICTDDFMIRDGVYKFDYMNLSSAHTDCWNVVNFHMQAETELIILHNTLTRESEILPYQELADSHGYELVSLVVENRHGSGSVHDVPDKTRRNMAERFSLKLIPDGIQQVGKIQENLA